MTINYKHIKMFIGSHSSVYPPNEAEYYAKHWSTFPVVSISHLHVSDTIVKKIF